MDPGKFIWCLESTRYANSAILKPFGFHMVQVYFFNFASSSSAAARASAAPRSPSEKGASVPYR